MSDNPAYASGKGGGLVARVVVLRYRGAEARHTVRTGLRLGGPGWLADPTFVSYDTWAGYPFPHDDLRLRDGNVATVAIGMDDDIESVERQAGGILALIFGHERGCYWANWDRLHVGVDGDDVFPA